MIAAEAAESRIICKLLDEGTLTPAGVVFHQREAEFLGVALVEILQQKDLVSEADVAQAYAETSGRRFLDLARRTPGRWHFRKTPPAARTAWYSARLRGNWWRSWPTPWIPR